MKKFTLFFVLVFHVLYGSSQTKEVSLMDYFPAPGQHINVENIGTPQAAEKMTTNLSSLISLGSFGGYVILKFEEACVNDSGNPYGVDFTVFGNSFEGSSEPGVIWVMKDENNNGLPDDTWYEIAGSNHFFSGIKKDYEVTYFKSSDRSIVWKDRQGESGRIAANEFNVQDYYPAQQFFPAYPKDSVTFRGTLLETFQTVSTTQELKLAAPAFGYADCHPRMPGIDLSLPDNPYTKEIEGAGGNPIDISWAIDSLGNYVELDVIHFVKIASGSLHAAGWLGEISTDIAWVQAVKPLPEMQGKENILVYKPVPSKIIKGDSLKLEAVYFHKGRRTDSPVLIESLDEKVAFLRPSGILETKSAGEVQLKFSFNGEDEYTSLKVAEPQYIRFKNEFLSVYPGDTLELIAEVYDNWEEKLNLYPVFSSSDSSAGKVIKEKNRFYFIALQSGEITLTATLDEFQLDQQMAVKIHQTNEKMRLLVSVKTASENVLPLQWIEAGLMDLNSLVENRSNDYNHSDRITLAHAMASALNKAGVSFIFRDDGAADGKLYLYKLEYDGLFSYGWGGKTNSSANARAWIVRLNNSQYMNNFDSIQLAAGDTVVLYHVPDILKPWSYSRLLPLPALDETERVTEFMLEQASCSLSNGEIYNSGFIPVSGAAVVSGTTFYTGTDGKVIVEYSGEFPYLITAGNDAVLLTEQLSTSINVPLVAYAVFPNPVEDKLFINFISSGNFQNLQSKVKLFNSKGQLLLDETFYQGPVSLNLSFLPSGQYQIVVSSGRMSETHKIIKR